MSTKSRILWAVVLLLAGSTEAGAFLARDRVEMAAAVVVNTVSGATRTGCETTHAIDRPVARTWWATVGAAKPHAQRGWEGVDHAIRCGEGAYEQPRANHLDMPSSPYLVIQVSTVVIPQAQMEGETVVSLALSTTLRELSRFGERGEPVYRESAEKRTLFFAEDSGRFVPLLLADAGERERLGFHEVWMRLRARGVAEESAAYGVVSVRSRAKGADILLDGGVAGKVAESGDTTLRNVRPGMREIRVREPSGRVAGKTVRVKANREFLVDLTPGVPARSPVSFRLAPHGKNDHGYEEYGREADEQVVVKIPAGEFLMGNSRTERAPLEHRVYVSEFLMDKTGVTWGRFKRFVEAKGIPMPPQEPYWGVHDEHPAVYVTWEEANAYCAWVGGRLPTEAEREKAARGTDGRKYPWGDDEPDSERGVFRRTWGYEATGAVGMHPKGASPYGLHDMGGNVWEWCSDWYADDYYSASPSRDPKGPPTGIAHSVRGGSWDSRPSVLSSSCRNWGHRGYREGDFGFRCVMDSPVSGPRKPE